jgi:hypothetical protein
MYLFTVGYSSAPWLSNFSHDWSNWSSPSFSNTTFQNFPGVSDLLPKVSKFQLHIKLYSKCRIAGTSHQILFWWLHVMRWARAHITYGIWEMKTRRGLLYTVISENFIRYLTLIDESSVLSSCWVTDTKRWIVTFQKKEDSSFNASGEVWCF